jgi:hypothetical protein
MQLAPEPSQGKEKVGTRPSPDEDTVGTRNLAQVRILWHQKPSSGEDTVGTRNLAQVRIQAPET